MSKVQIREGTDYELPDSLTNVWVKVGNISVHIKRDDQGVVVDLYPRHDEMSDLLAGCSLTFAGRSSVDLRVDDETRRELYDEEYDRVVGKIADHYGYDPSEVESDCDLIDEHGNIKR